MMCKKVLKFYPYIISTIAILISGGSLIATLILSGVFSEFKPEVKINGFILITDKDLDLGYIVSTSFINKNNKDGIIEEIYIDLNYKNWNIKLEPINEISIEEFFKFRDLKPSVYLGPFRVLSIAKKGIEHKTFLFYPTSKEKRNFEPGNYNIDIYIKTAKNDQFQKMDSFGFKVGNDAIFILKEGRKSIYFMGDSRIYTLEKD